MKPSLLKRHLYNKHKHLKDKPIDFFKRQRSELKNIKTPVQSFTTTNKQALEASYLVSLKIAQTDKPHTSGETLILPAVKDLVT